MEKFYITTAIDYVNASPHLGHAYEKICADVLARWHRLNGEEVWFLTGTDENAQKNVQAAKEKGMSTRTFVNSMATRFLDLCKKLNISHDDFIRTTEERHMVTAQKIFSQIQENGDIYKGRYSGMYCQGCEAFYTEKDLVKGKCPEHDTAPQHLEEENYFFRLSKYQDNIMKWYNENPDFVFPLSRRNEMLERLKDPLKDLSVSRYGVEWGIPFPSNNDHKIYVWSEALSNYVTALGYPSGSRYKKYWPADVHLIGTGINWFHSVIWPALLLSAGLELPKRVVVHGYITHDGKKMSKSLGNVVDPFDIIKRYGADQLRYFLIRDIPFGEDGDFSEKALKARINGELLADLGNLVSRVLALAEKSSYVKGKSVLEEKLYLEDIKKHMDSLELHRALEGVFRFIRECNAYINETEPWKLKGDELGEVLYNLLEGLRIIAILIHPFLPATSKEMNKQLGVKLGTLEDCVFGKWEGKPKKGKHLFEKVK